MNRAIDKYSAALAVVDFENYLKLYRGEKYEIYSKNTYTNSQTR